MDNNCRSDSLFHGCMDCGYFRMIPLQTTSYDVCRLLISCQIRPRLADPKIAQPDQSVLP